MQITIDSKLIIHGVSALPTEWRIWLENLCTFQLMGETVELFQYDNNDSLLIPRGLELDVVSALRSSYPDLTVKDTTYKGSSSDLAISEKLNFTDGDYCYQDSAAEDLLKHRTARLEAPTGAGKTLISCLSLYKNKKYPALFLTMKNNLLGQFVEEACFAFNIQPDEIGIIQGTKCKIAPITVGSLPTMGSKRFLADKIHELRNKFAIVFFDECHRSKALTYRDVIMQLNPAKLFGVSATPEESLDAGELRMMEAILGPVAVRITEDDIPNRIKPQTFIKKTGIYFKYQEGTTAAQSHFFRARFHKNVAKSVTRNDLIVADVVGILNQNPNNQVLICVSLVDHGETLYKLLKKRGIAVEFPYSDVKDYQKMQKYKIPAAPGSKSKFEYSKVILKQDLDSDKIQESVTNLEAGVSRVLIGTYEAFTEGFNCKSINTVIFAGPVSGKNKIRNYQLIGRCARKYKDKTNVYAIYYSDNSSPSKRLAEWADGFYHYCSEKWGNCFFISPP